MQVCVTGGGGFLGRYIVEQLRDRNDSVRVFSRGAYPDLAAQGVEVVRGDVQNATDVRNACQGMDAVIHTAAIPGIWGKWETFYNTNTVGTEHVIAACRELGVRRLVYTSSPSVVFDGESHLNADESLPYPESYLCHYPHSKALAERAVLAANDHQLATVALRPHLIWGPRDNHLIPRLLDRALKGRLVRVGDGSNLVSTAYVENAAAAHVQALDRLASSADCAGKAYFISEPQSVLLWEWVDQILKLGNLPPVKRSISPRLAYRVGAGFERLFRAIGREQEPPMTRFLALQLSQSHAYRIDQARADFGYNPQVSFEEGMARLEPEVEAFVAERRR